MPISDATVDQWVDELTTTNRERMKQAVDKHYNDEYFDSIGTVEDVIKSEFPYRGWREMFFGCLPAIKQIHLLYEQGEPWHRDKDLVVGLLKQIRDEYKHARLFTNFAEEFGGQSDLASWTPPTYDELIATAEASIDHDRPHHIAVAFQCGTEIGAAFMSGNLAEYVRPEYPDVAHTLQDVISDEGDHVHVGRMVIKRFAEPDEFDRLQAITDRKYDAVVKALEAKTANQR